MSSAFERYLTVWVGLCMAVGILLGIAPCTAMVLVWGYLARGNDGLTLVMVAVNSLIMLVLYGVLGGFLLGVGRLPVPWQALLLSIAAYVALPLAAGSCPGSGSSPPKGASGSKAAS